MFTRHTGDLCEQNQDLGQFWVHIKAQSQQKKNKFQCHQWCDGLAIVFIAVISITEWIFSIVECRIKYTIWHYSDIEPHAISHFFVHVFFASYKVLKSMNWIFDKLSEWAGK